MALTVLVAQDKFTITVMINNLVPLRGNLKATKCFTCTS